MTRKLNNKTALSSRVKRGICFFLVALTSLAQLASAQKKRPQIQGIDQVQIYTSNVSAETDFYRQIGLFMLCPHGETHSQKWNISDDCGFLPKYAFSIGALQMVSFWPMPDPPPDDLIRKVIFSTNDVPGLRRYLRACGIRPSKPQKPDVSLAIVDPDGHLIEFVQRYGSSRPAPDPSASSLIPIPQHLIHAGFIVRDNVAMDHFYKDILGFRPYWHGGMKDDETSWISLQVPDGTDWIEFMVNLPPNPDRHLRGVMNHIALGVPDIHEAAKQLLKNGMKLTEEPKMGRDGKWQLNLYDPDQTRVELMEFTPVEKPCCSEYTGPHPKP